MTRTVFLLAGALALIPAPAQAATALYGRDPMTNAAGWGVNVTGTDNLITFNYDYSADGIPEAPNSEAGDSATRGLKLEANRVDPAASESLTLYPIGQNFTGSYVLSFDAWQNFDADELAGASVGTTEFLGGGIGYDNATADIGSGVQAIATGDGGSSNDWRVFKAPPSFFVPDADMAGGTHNGADSYYADFFPAVAPPAAQGQTASGTAGSPSFQWYTWVFTTVNDGIAHSVVIDVEKPNGDRLRIADIDCTDTSDGSSGCASEGNISLFYGDIFSSVAPNPARMFGLIDNALVMTVPEPATALLVACSLMALGAGRRRS